MPGAFFIRTSARSEHSAGPGGACREPPLSPPLASGRGVQAASSSGGHRALTQSISHPKTPKKVTLPPPAAGPSVLLGRGLALTQPRAMGPGQGTPRGRAQSFLEGSVPFGGLSLFWRAPSCAAWPPAGSWPGRGGWERPWAGRAGCRWQTSGRRGSRGGGGERGRRRLAPRR